MAKYYLTKKAIDDLTKIWNYTYEEWSEQQADKYYNMLIDNFKVIAENPNLGKSYLAITPTLFGFKAAKHIIFYRKINDNEVEITRILHEMMDLKNSIHD